MHIAYLVASFPEPSETFVSREVSSLRKLGFEVEVIAFMRPLSRTSNRGVTVPSMLDPQGVYYGNMLQSATGLIQSIWGHHPAKALNREFQRWSSRKSNPYARLGRAFAVAKRVKQQRVEHIHAHWAYASQVAALVHEITGVPYSVSIHAHEVAHENGHFPAIFRTLAFATFCNRAAMEYLLKRLPEEYRQCSHLVYHGVDLGAFAASPMPLPCQPLHVISAGRLTRTKGFDRLISGCAEARRSGIDVDLTILGSGSLHDSLQRQAHEMDFARWLNMPGWVPHSEVYSYLVRSHILALLADDTYHDGLPNVVLEAMACGRAVILSPLPAATEAVTHGREGFILSTPKDIGGLVNALRTLAQHPERLVEMGMAARNRAVAQYDDQVHIQKLAGLFHRSATERQVRRQDDAPGSK